MLGRDRHMDSIGVASYLGLTGYKPGELNVLSGKRSTTYTLQDGGTVSLEHDVHFGYTAVIASPEVPREHIEWLEEAGHVSRERANLRDYGVRFS